MYCGIILVETHMVCI